MRLWIQTGVVGITVILTVSAAVAWRSVRREQAELQLKLNAAERQLRDADARQTERKVELGKALAELEAQKRRVRTPSQVLEALPEVLPLPTAIAFEHTRLTPIVPGSPSEQRGREPSTPPGQGSTSMPPVMTLPPEDLKPLYDFALGCKACEAELSASKKDLADERVKTAALSRERDSALQAARGGSTMKRVMRAAKWFVVGAAVGAAAAAAAH